MEAAEQRSFCPHCNAIFRTPFNRCPLDGAELATCEDDPLVGTTLDSRYQIEECIGEGGMGRVYRAKHVRMSRQYAIKILFGDLAGDSRMRSRFAREAEAVSRLSHVNVISVVDFGETDEGLMYLVMDLASGQSLAEVVHEQAPMPSARAMNIVGQLLKGLAHAHGHGLVHRDFKCENVIMVTEDGREVPKIVDFGICIIIEEHPSSTMLTSSGMVLGTPAVMAPEQASGEQVDNRTDLFSLGIVAYQMLSGLLPFDGTPLDMARKNLYDTIPSIYERSSIAVSPDIQSFVSKLTEKDPDQRFQTAGEALAQLAVTQQGPWNDPTPMPGLPPQPTPHPFPVAVPQDTTTPAPFADTAVTPTSPPASAAMHTAHVSPFHQPFYGGQPAGNNDKRNKGIIAAVVLLLAGILLAVTLSGDESTSGDGIAGINNDTDSEAIDEGQPDERQPDENQLPESTKVADNAVEEKGHQPTDVEPEIDIEPLDVEPLDMDAGAPDKVIENAPKPDKINRRKGKKNRKNKNSKTPPNVTKPPQKTPEEILQTKIRSNLSLYGRVGTRLARLKKRVGAAQVRSISTDYFNISRSRLGREPGVQDDYSATLRRLMREIKAKSK